MNQAGNENGRREKQNLGARIRIARFLDDLLEVRVQVVTVALVVAGVLLRNGMGAESLAWTLMFVLMPLTCVYYPVSVLPPWLQVIAWALPPTYVFEGMRALLMEHVIRLYLMVEAFALNAFYFAAGVLAFLQLLKSARRVGSLLQTGE